MGGHGRSLRAISQINPINQLFLLAPPHEPVHSHSRRLLQERKATHVHQEFVVRRGVVQGLWPGS